MIENNIWFIISHKKHTGALEFI